MEEAQQRIDAQRRGPKLDIRKALRHSFLNDSLSRISEGLSTLESLTERGIELEPARKGRFQGRFLKIIRTVAEGLYRAVRSNLDCPCEHQVCLQLEKRTASITPGDTNDGRIIKDLEFQLALSYERVAPVPGANCDRNWADILVKRTAGKRGRAAPSATSSSSKKKGKRRLRFADLALSPPAASSAPVAPGSVNPQQASIELGVISEQSLSSSDALKLCEAIRQPGRQIKDQYYGLIVDCASLPASSYTVQPIPGKRRGNSGNSAISLNEALTKNERYMLLSEQCRLRLAVVISSSVLQLHGSSWMPEIITSKDIYFIQKPDDPTCDHFFILKTFHHSVESMDEEPGTDRRNPTLFSLGILLIELALGETFESLRNEREKSWSFSQFLTDYVTARRLIGEVNRVIGTICGSAIARCIDGEFHERESGLEDEEFSHDVYSGVVALLEKELENSIV